MITDYSRSECWKWLYVSHNRVWFIGEVFVDSSQIAAYLKRKWYYQVIVPTVLCCRRQEYVDQRIISATIIIIYKIVWVICLLLHKNKWPYSLIFRSGWYPYPTSLRYILRPQTVLKKCTKTPVTQTITQSSALKKLTILICVSWLAGVCQNSLMILRQSVTNIIYLLLGQPLRTFTEIVLHTLSAQS